MSHEKKKCCARDCFKAFESIYFREVINKRQVHCQTKIFHLVQIMMFAKDGTMTQFLEQASQTLGITAKRAFLASGDQPEVGLYVSFFDQNFSV